MTVEVLVTSEAANGEVGLSSTQPQRIQEPETGSNTRKVRTNKESVPVNTGHSHDDVSILGQRRRR